MYYEVVSNIAFMKSIIVYLSGENGSYCEGAIVVLIGNKLFVFHFR